MSALLQIGLINAFSAAALAVVAAAASAFFRRPPLTRALWILVLLKLLTPPIWSIPVWHHPVVAFQRTAPIATVTPSVPLPADEPQDETIDSGLSQPMDSLAPTATQTVAVATNTQVLLRYWPIVVCLMWFAGSCIYTLAILMASLRIGQLVRRSIPAPRNIDRRVGCLATAMGLGCRPQVSFLARPIPPMLCAIGMSPRILLPASLWQRLDERQQDTVLAHELAHLRRRDHWVRAFELLVSVLYWWHPVVWWARRELREAAEQCCDAWVVWTMPRLARIYAAALVETIEYISSAPAGLPALASGMGQFTDLKRRLVMIKQGNMMRSLTRPALAAICGAAGLLLPLSPTLGQSAPEAPTAPIAITPPAAAEPAPAVAPAPTAPVAIELAPAPQKAAREDDDADPRSNSDRTELQKARAEIQQLRAQLRAAERRLSEMDRAQRNADRASRNADRQSKAGRPEPSPAPMPEYGAKPRTLPPLPSYGPAAKAFSRTQDDAFIRAGEKFRAAGQQPDDEAFARASEKLRAAGQQLNDARDRTRQTVERRLDQMERQLTNMVDQLRQMKRQLGNQDGDRPSPERK